MQNLSNTPVPQWKIKYDSQFNVSPQQNTGGSDTPPENGGGKFPWAALFVGMIIIVGLYYKAQMNEQDQYPT